MPKDCILTFGIPTYRRFGYLQETLESIYAQSLSEDMYKVLIIDNSLLPEKSQDCKKNWSYKTNINYIITNKSGASYARNIAIKHCTTEYMAILDDDVILDKYCLEAMLESIKLFPGAAAIGTKLLPKWEVSRPEWLTLEPLLWNYGVFDWGNLPTTLPVSRWIISACTVYKLSAVKKIPEGFPEHIGVHGGLHLVHEETALNLALRKLGYDIAYDPRIKVQHHIQKERCNINFIYNESIRSQISFYLLVNDIKNYKFFDIKRICNSVNIDTNLTMEQSFTPEDILKKAYQYGEVAIEKCENFFGKKYNINKFFTTNTIYVVTPVLNCVDTIDYTILSIVSQEGDFAIRYHIQDGGSTDGTLEKLHNWKKILDSNTSSIVRCRNVVFTYESTPDNGMYDAIAKAYGKFSPEKYSFLTWINGDDYFMPGAFNNIDSLARHAPQIQWVTGQPFIKTVSGTNLTFSKYLPQQCIAHGICDGKNIEFIQQEGSFFTKELWDNAKGLNTTLKYAGDWDLWRRFATITPLWHLDFATRVFRVRPGQLSQQASSDGNSYNKEMDSIKSQAVRAQSMASLAHDGFSNLDIHLIYSTENGLKPVIEKLGSRLTKAMQAFCQAHQMQNSHMEKIEKNPATLPFPSKEKKFSFLDRFKKFIGFRWEVLRLRKSGLFWPNYYLSNNFDVYAKGIDPLYHFVTNGWKEGRNPNPLFDTKWYLSTQLDVCIADINPLLHFLEYGATEGRDPSPSFSIKNYFIHNPDVKKSGLNPLVHYLRYGITEQRQLF